MSERAEQAVVLAGDDESAAPASGQPFEFMGETFHLRPVEDYQWELLVFADVAVQGEAIDPLRQNAATLRLLRSAIVDADWRRFFEHASKNRAQTERDLMPVVVALHWRATARPTTPPADSSAGRQDIPQSSEVELYSRVIAREEAAGRPDRALMALLAAEAAAEGGLSGT